MFVSDKVVFVELHKTGGTHIGSWLQQLVGGEQIGKHNRLPSALWSRFVIGSIRNPWDWYVSLWAYGCGGNGSVRRQSTRLVDLAYCWDELPREMGQRFLTPLQWMEQVGMDVFKPLAKWRACYRDSNDPHAFREWLKLVLDSNRRFDIGEGYGFSPISRSFGLLTYRYLKLFTKLEGAIYSDRRLSGIDYLHVAWERDHLVNFLVRNEHLESDLIAALKLALVELTAAQEADIQLARNKKINASRRQGVSFYYDEETIELVNHRERFIIERHQYSVPR